MRFEQVIGIFFIPFSSTRDIVSHKIRCEQRCTRRIKCFEDNLGVIRVINRRQLDMASFRGRVLRGEWVQNLRTKFRDIGIIARDEGHAMHLGGGGK